ncbi:MAG: hypothetical protein ACK5MN_09440 [Lachnospiraceae bacterium]
MLQWNKKLYVGESLRGKQKSIRRRIIWRRLTPGIFLLTLSHNPNHVLEIISSNYLLQKAARRHCPVIIGMAGGRDEAMELMQKILLEVYEVQGDFHVEAYLQTGAKG